MNTEFSLAYLTVPGTHPADQVEIAAKCGYEGVSLRSISMRLPGEPDFRLSDREIFRSVKKALDSTGVKFMDLELARIAVGVDVSSYEKDFQAAEKLGARWAITSVWSDHREFVLEQLGKLCDMAAEHGITLNLEFVPFSSVGTLEAAQEIIDVLGKPNLKLMVDFLHAHRANVTPETLKKIPADRFGFVHLCDGPAWIPPMDHPDMKGVAREKRLYAGEGQIDIAGMWKAMPQVPYVSIELPNLWRIRADGKLGHAKRCLRTAKEYFWKHGLM